MIEVKLGSGKLLSNLAKNEAIKIRKDLTFINPSYEQVLKYSRWNTTRIPKFLKYYENVGESILVPRGYKIDSPNIVISDERLCFGDIKYPELKISLRKVQADAIENFKCNGTIILPTGTGKSITGIALAGKLKERALVVVNKDDLVDGWKNDIKLCYGEIGVGLVKGKHFNIGEQFTITTIQTLSRLGENKLKMLQDSISLLICDEVHHAGSKSYQVLNSFPAKYVLGLTATKFRNDGLVDVLDLICGETIFEFQEDLNTEDIIPLNNIHIIKKDSNIEWKPIPVYYWSSTKTTVRSIKYGGKEYPKGSSIYNQLLIRGLQEGSIQRAALNLQEAYKIISNDDEFNYQIVRDLIYEYRKGRSCIAFFKTKEQINRVYELLRPYCSRVQKFYGDMKESKAEIKQKAENKDILITLATIAIATEGTNIKPLEVGFLCSSVANKKDLVQIIGRLRRKCTGKKDIYFYDYRHPKVVGIKNHGDKRDKIYFEIGIKST